MGFYEAGVQIGLGAENQIFLSDNDWILNVNSVSGNPTSAFTTYGSYDYIRMCVTGYAVSQLQYPLILRPGTQSNRYHIRQSTAQNPVSDSGANNGGYIGV